jgi:hypothetical protein
VSWKPAVIAALVVVLAGVGVGVLVGGKETTKRTTVLSTVTTAASADSGSGGGTSTPDPTEGSTEPGGASGSDPATPAVPVNSEIERFAEDNMSVDTDSFVEQIGRERYRDSLVTNLFESNGEEQATLLSPIPGTQYTRLTATVGFAAGAPSDATVVLDVRADAPDGDKLLAKPIKLKGSAPRDIDVPLGDAQSVVFVFDDPTCTADEFGDTDCASSQASFVIGDAHFGT